MNNIAIIGRVDFIFNNSGILKVKRLSGTEDQILFELSDEMADKELPTKIAALGEVITRNVKDSEGNHKRMFVRINDFMPAMPASTEFSEVEMDCYIVHKKALRTTPKGKVIIDVILAYNDDDKSYYPQAIAWGRHAHIINALPVGTKVHIKGRYQSRQYHKSSDPDGMDRTAYEISIMEVKYV